MSKAFYVIQISSRSLSNFSFALEPFLHKLMVNLFLCGIMLPGATTLTSYCSHVDDLTTLVRDHTKRSAKKLDCIRQGQD